MSLTIACHKLILCDHCMFPFLSHFRAKLEPLVSEKHGSDAEALYKVQKKGGKAGQCLYLLLVVLTIIASKFYM